MICCVQEKNVIKKYFFFHRVELCGFVDKEVEKIESKCLFFNFMHKKIIHDVESNIYPINLSFYFPRFISLNLHIYDKNNFKKNIKVFKAFRTRVKNNKIEKIVESDAIKTESDTTIYKKSYYNPLNNDDYNKWYKNYINNRKIPSVKKNLIKPFISFVMPVYNVPGRYLRTCIESILNQDYENFELCVADDKSTNPETIKTLKEYEHNPKINILWREENGHISKTTNSAISIAKGEYIALVDNDDVVDKYALNYVVDCINKNQNVDLIYTDEDKINDSNFFFQPNFKPDFAFENFMNVNYICHLCVISKKMISKVKGFREGYEGAQDYDLFLRIIKNKGNIIHIPQILYHWRILPGSTSSGGTEKPYATKAGIKALKDFFEYNDNVIVQETGRDTAYDVSYNPFFESMLIVISLSDINKKEVMYKIINNLMVLNNTNVKFYVVDETTNNYETYNDELYLFDDYKNLIDIEIIKDYLELNHKISLKSNSPIFFIKSIENFQQEWFLRALEYINSPNCGIIGSYEQISNNKTFGYVVDTKDNYLKPLQTPPNHSFFIHAPYNTSVVSLSNFVIRQDVFVDSKGFKNYTSNTLKLVELQLNVAYKLNKNNMVFPDVTLFNNSGIDYEDIVDLEEIKWIGEIEHDKFYSERYSCDKSYMLEEN